MTALRDCTGELINDVVWVDVVEKGRDFSKWRDMLDIDMSVRCVRDVV